MEHSFLRNIPFAHRGLHGAVPENSLPAFEAALRRGYGIETDVRFTKDKRLVLFHDDDLLRMTGDKRKVIDCTLAELREIPLGGTEKIPLLSELLDMVGGKVPLLIEIKNMGGVKPKEIAAALQAETREYGGAYAVQSFNPLYVRAYKKLCGEVPCGVLGTAEKGAAKGFEGFIVKSLPLNFYVKPDFISYRKEDMPRRRVMKFKGVRLVWVVRSEEEANFSRAFADNIIFESFLP